MPPAARPITARFNPARPCPVCGTGTKGCSATDDGLHLCRGAPADPAGWKLVKPGGDFSSYRRAADAPPDRNGHPPARPARDWPAEAARFAARMTPAARGELAAALGLPAAVLDALPLVGWVPDHTVGGRPAPCWTFPEVDPAGRVVGVNRRFREPVSVNGGSPTTKAMLGGASRGLTTPVGWRDRPGPVFVVEGASDVLALTAAGLAAVGRFSNTGGAELLAELLADLPAERPVIVLGENDARPSKTRPGQTEWPGRAGAEKVAGVLGERLGRPVRVAYPPEGLKDARQWVLDLAAGFGEAEDWAAVGETIRRHCETTAAHCETTPGPRAEVQLSTDLHLDTAAVLDVLAARDTGLFQRAGRLVHVRVGAAGPRFLARHGGQAAAVEEVGPDHLAERASRVITFLTWAERKGELVPRYPPERLMRTVAAVPLGDRIRPLAGVLHCPTVRPDGSLLTAPGYDPDTGLYFAAEGCPRVEVPDRPTRGQVAAALEVIRYPFADFPFARECHRAAAVAALLTVVGRHAFDGPAPVFLIDANRAGTGKGLLADVCGMVATGTRLASMANTTDDAEMRKRLVSLALAAEPVVKIDNVGEHDAFGTPAFDSAVTAGVVSDRLLGRNETAKVALDATWFVTGNNIRLAGDAARRGAHVRLETPLENPEQRPDIHERRLLDHVREHRGRYLAACLTVLRGWFTLAGGPAQLPPWGSFEGWSDVIRQCVVWLGLPDPYETRALLREQSDPAAASFRVLVHNWEYLDPPGRGLTAARVIELLGQPEADDDRAAVRDAIKTAVLEICPGRGNDLPSPKTLGRRLTSLRGRVCDGLRLVGGQDRNGTTRWSVEQTEEPKQTDEPQPPQELF